MRTEDQKVIERLSKAGVGFSVALSTPGGAETVTLNAREALAYLANPQEFAAGYYGLPLADYETWVALDGQAMCGASTRAGGPCRNPVSGPTQLSAGDWKDRHGGLCAVHGGESSADMS